MRSMNVRLSATAGTSVVLFCAVFAAVRSDTPLPTFVETAGFGLAAVLIVIVPVLVTSRRRGHLRDPRADPSSTYRGPLW
jgi:hypothetical protein